VEATWLTRVTLIKFTLETVPALPTFAAVTVYVPRLKSEGMITFITVPPKVIEFGPTCCDMPLPLKISTVEGLTNPEPETVIMLLGVTDIGDIELKVGAMTVWEEFIGVQVYPAGQVLDACRELAEIDTPTWVLVDEQPYKPLSSTRVAAPTYPVPYERPFGVKICAAYFSWNPETAEATVSLKVVIGVPEVQSPKSRVGESSCKSLTILRTERSTNSKITRKRVAKTS
jgi:hypothetical protein